MGQASHRLPRCPAGSVLRAAAQCASLEQFSQSLLQCRLCFLGCSNTSRGCCPADASGTLTAQRAHLQQPPHGALRGTQGALLARRGPASTALLLLLLHRRMHIRGASEQRGWAAAKQFGVAPPDAVSCRQMPVAQQRTATYGACMCSRMLMPNAASCRHGPTAQRSVGSLGWPSDNISGGQKRAA